MDNEKILYLLDQYNNGTASAEDLKALDNWYNSFEQDEKLTNGLPGSKVKNIEKRMLFGIDQRIDAATTGSKPISRRLSIQQWLTVAAAVFLILSLAGFFAVKKLPLFHTEDTVGIDVLPGGNKAILILGNGKKIDLNTQTSGIISQESGTQITKSTNSSLTYIADHSNNQNNLSHISTNTIVIPNGGQYEVQLPDGTHVWLNAASSLTYPTRFTGHNRKVKLTGEGYFEVAKDKLKPFEVETADQQVQVLGTHFNINAYAEEKIQKTTLLEGSVKVISKNNSILIKPSEQVINQNNDLSVKTVNSANAIAWKNGVFQFDHTELRSLMLDLSRWYNVEVVYEGHIKKRFFSGTIDKSYTLVEVLKVLELGRVHYQIEQARTANKQAKLVIIP
ncbi:anti-sigma factor [Pedobacter sp. HMWF019]|uniref:FecR family protein n=1 Tax=Pedobacter sp. HMWF019 TaxID=2056856 RepID=UPI000D345FFA|nr:FecR family protein [Pedobacter sp. HMWF019]PTS97746.1 anti-sigma factor [Pedobacter sp. HMWF019]